VAYNASEFDRKGPWGPLVILVPVIGGLGVTWIVSTSHQKQRGMACPRSSTRSIQSRHYQADSGCSKVDASALAIGSGSSVGREGPIIQIGSALGSTFGQIIRLPAGQRITLVAAGAGAGIAATFNTPIGGVLFASELMLPEISVDTFLPVALATGTATFIGHLFSAPIQPS